MSFDKVVNCLEKPRKYKCSKSDIINAVRSVCPSCGGSSSKLNVSETTDGKVLIHCFGNCSIIDVITAMGLDISELFPEKYQQSQTSKQMDTIKGWDWWSIAGVLECMTVMLHKNYLMLASCSTNDQKTTEIILSIFYEFYDLAQQVKFGKKGINYGK